MSQHKLRAIETHVLAARLEETRLAELAARREEAMAKLIIPHIAPVPLVQSGSEDVQRFDDTHGLDGLDDALKMLDEGAPDHVSEA